MAKIRELPTELINQIAAGEVVESPQSVVKELLENAIDAGATEIQIETKEAGVGEIRITDNGCGMDEEDMRLSVQRYATSKISELKDLEAILTYGFRGEALASIASVSHLQIESGTGSRLAHKLDHKNGVTNLEEIPGFQGTRISIQDLFFNTPVRRKFLKSERSEDRKIKERVSVQALAREDIRFQFVQNGKEIFRLPAESKKERILSLFGQNLKDHLLEVSLERPGIKAHGFISDPDFYKSNRSSQYFFVNGRPVEIKYGSFLLKKCYDELLPPNAHPYCYLFFEIDPSLIDVNVHPTKKEIRFLNEESFNAFFIQLLQKELRSSTPVSFLELKKRLSQPISMGNRSLPEDTTPPLTLIARSQSTPAFHLEGIGPGTQIEALRQNPDIHREFVPKKHFGILFETFILAEAEDGLYIIDQHTAHERIRYEEVLEKLKSKSYGVQPLLTPIRLDLTNSDVEQMMERFPEYQEVGIHLEVLGEDSIVIRELPAYIEAGKEKDTILDFMNRIQHPDVQEPDLYDLMAKCVACRSAIKKGDFVSDHILAEILNRLSYCKNPSRCPHGRPTLVKLTLDDLQRMFHRK